MSRGGQVYKLTGLLAAASIFMAAGSVSAQEPVKVGIALDLSGPFSVLGAEARDGFNLAIETLDGTLGGLPAEFLQNDFGGNPEQATQLVNRYIQREDIDFFTGPIGSNAALAVAPALFKAQVPYISSNPGASQFAGTRCHPFFFGQVVIDTYAGASVYWHSGQDS